MRNRSVCLAAVLGLPAVPATLAQAPSAPPDLERYNVRWESGDAVQAEPAGAVTWFHRNAYSVVPLSLTLQGLGEFAELVKDPLVDRTFGGRILANGFVADGPSALKSASPGKQFHIRVVAHAAQTSTLDEWKAQVTAVGRLTEDGAAAMRATAKWWADLPRDGRSKAVACHLSRRGRIT